ncbi:protein phosphatase 1 regulatory subunit 1B isoform X1 [Scophthalmus maximus]|uniref:protein phosphatase 1 regulatory subunit 1B isoform X1 n=1 Tax=Scophthalmus maximus TaxID=52904 RepID=UPI0015E11AEC|nr:protein phosphatase 1 regulatory subunit 1B isoform X1 [Scophthalmus maximus]
MEPTEVEGEPKERKKIHFAVTSSVPTNLDPRQVEMIRRRRPTPATLFRVADQSSPEDDQSTHQVKWVVGENGVLKPKRVNPNVYQPPSLKAVQKMAEAQMLKLGVYPPLEDPYEGEEYEDHWQGEEGEDARPAKAADHQETATTEQSVKFSSVRETAKQIQAAAQEEEEEDEEEEEEEEEEGEEEGDKSVARREENSRGSN